MMEFTFEKTPLELLLDTLQPGDRISALDCLERISDLSQEDAETHCLP